MSFTVFFSVVHTDISCTARLSSVCVHVIRHRWCW